MFLASTRSRYIERASRQASSVATRYRIWAREDVRFNGEGFGAGSSRRGIAILSDCALQNSDHKTQNKAKSCRLNHPVIESKRRFSTINPIHGRSEVEEDRLVVIGTGVAGCATALIAAEKYSIPVTLLCAGSVMTDCNSYWAQGGIIFRNDDPQSGDSAESLMKDVHRAGAGLCDDDAVRKLALEGPDRVRELLLSFGKEQNGEHEGPYARVPFDRSRDGKLSFCLEASHSAPRIIHRADHTGRAITDCITRAAHSHPLINVTPNSLVTDLIMSDSTPRESRMSKSGSEKDAICLGVEVFDKTTGEQRQFLTNRGVAVSAGGLCGIYAHSTNPNGFNAVGSGVAMALRAGATCSDLEYVQFHPTALNIPGKQRFLLTEALRGEGAKLITSSGRKFAKEFHPDGELAPRDIVARGVFEQMQKGEKVYLDITHRDAAWLEQRFPSIQEYVTRRHGLDMTKDPLPVTPAAHYACGGILTDGHGRTNVANLYAAGEAARTGLHGGNRLASTSLLEALVWGASVADFVGDGDSSSLKEGEGCSRQLAAMSSLSSLELREWAKSELDLERWSAESLAKSKGTPNRSKEASHLLSELRNVMWDDVGVVRTNSGLTRACDVLREIRTEAEDLYDEHVSVETIMLRDASWAGLEVARLASENSVSKGAHFVTDDEEEELEGCQPFVGAM